MSVASDERKLLQEAAAALRSDRPRGAHRLYGQALELASTDEERAEALEGLGFVAHRTGRPREAARLFEEALQLLGDDPADRPEIADALGRAYAAVGELERSTALFESALRVAKRRGDRIWQVGFAALLSYALTDSGKFDEAERMLADVRAGAEGTDDPAVLARVEWSEARLRGEQGETERALEHARAALDLFTAAGAERSIALAYDMLASLTNDLGRPEEALEILRDGWPLLLQNATPLQVAHARIEEARALAALGENEGAAAVAMRVAAQLDGTHPGDAGRAYVLLGEIFDKLGDIARARQLYETGIRLLTKQGPNRYLVNAYRRLADLFEAEYRSEDAVGVLRRALAVQAQVGRAIADDL